MAGKIKKIIRYFVNVLSILIVSVSVVLMISVLFSTGGNIPNVMGYSLLRVLTESMNPQIPADSLIIVHREEAGEIQEGDIISFYSTDSALDGMINTHRVTRIETTEEQNYKIYTKGDANEMEDAYPTDQEHLIGKVVWSSFLSGKIVRLVSNPLVFIPIIIAPLLLIMIYHIRQVVHTTKEISAEQEEAYQEAILKIYQNKKKKQEKKEQDETEKKDCE